MGLNSKMQLYEPDMMAEIIGQLEERKVSNKLEVKGAKRKRLMSAMQQQREGKIFREKLRDFENS